MSDFKDIDLGDLLTQLETSTSTFVKKGAVIPILKWLICRASQIDELLADSFVDADPSDLEEDEEPSDLEDPSDASFVAQRALTADEVSELAAGGHVKLPVESKSSSLSRNGALMHSNPMLQEEEESVPSSLSARAVALLARKTPPRRHQPTLPGARSGESLLSYMSRE